MFRVHQRGTVFGSIREAEGPSTQYLRSLVPNTIKGMVFATRVLKYWVLGPSGSEAQERHHIRKAFFA